ncbi:MAG: hypothetical protein U1E65_17785 [Myxococcota bacterium]
MISRALAPLSLCLSTGCLLSHTDLTELSSMGTTTFSGYSQTPGDVVRVRAYDRLNQQWVTLAQATSASSPTIPANSWGGNPALYAWSAVTPLGTASDPQGRCLLDPNCSAREASPGTSSVRLMFESGSPSSPTRAMVYDAKGMDCLNARITAGDPFNTAAYNCRSPSYPLLNLRYSNFFENLPPGPPAGRLGAISGWAGFAGTSGGGVWLESEGWWLLTSAPTSLAPEVAPSVSMFLGAELAFAVGTDRRLYGAHGQTLGPMQAWGGISDVAGHLSAVPAYRIDTHEQEAWLSYVKNNATVEVAMLSSTSVRRIERFSGNDVTSTPVLNPNWISDAYIVVREGGSLRFYRMSPSDPPVLLGTVAANAVGELSRMILDGGQLHVLYHRTLGSGVDLVHASFRPDTPFSLATRVVHHLGSVPTQGPTLGMSSYGKLMTAWIEGNDVGFASYASSGALGTWEEDRINGFAPLDGTIDVTGWSVEAVVREIGGTPHRVKLEEIHGRRLVERSFDTYTTNTTSGCGPGVDSPAPLRDLISSTGAYGVLAVGRFLTRLPAGWPAPIFGALGERTAASGGGQPTGRAAELSKTSLVLSNTPTTYSCGGSVYLSRDQLPNTREIGRALARGLGIRDDGTPPSAWNAAVSGIPLATLQAGSALFGSGLTSASCTTFNCVGFVGSTPFERSGREAAFAEVLEAYVRESSASELLYNAANQRAARPCNDLLSRKIDWIRTNIFRGEDLRPLWDFGSTLGLCSSLP